MVTVMMILLTIGLLIMTSLNRQLSAQLRINGDERDYIRAYNRALSSLNWGLQQLWPYPDKNWRCQSAGGAEEGLSACLKIVNNSENALLKSGDINPHKTGAIALYYLVTPQTEFENGGLPDGRVSLARLPSGWLDFCPVGDKECEHDEN